MPDAGAGPLGPREQGRQLVRLEERRELQLRPGGVGGPNDRDAPFEVVGISEGPEGDGAQGGVVGVQGAQLVLIAAIVMAGAAAIVDEIFAVP